MIISKKKKTVPQNLHTFHLIFSLFIFLLHKKHTERRIDKKGNFLCSFLAFAACLKHQQNFLFDIVLICVCKLNLLCMRKHFKNLNYCHKRILFLGNGRRQKEEVEFVEKDKL